MGVSPVFDVLKARGETPLGLTGKMPVLRE
jgi:hypothetical protein